jgi:integrase
MPRKAEKVRVEDGLYRSGKTYIACATPSGSRRSRWRTLGQVGIMEARRLRDEFRAEVRSGGVVLASRASFREVADAWLEHMTNLRDLGQLGVRTWEKYEGDLRLHVRPWFGSKQVRAITPDDLVAWHRQQRQGGASDWAIRARWIVLRGVLGYALRHRLIAANPADALESREVPKVGESRQRFLSEEEMTLLLERVPKSYAAAVATALFTGLRQSELLGLTWRDIDFAGQQVHVEFQMERGRDPRRSRLKTKASVRDVVLMPALATILKAHRLASPHSRDYDLVFATVHGKTIGHRNLAQRGLDRATGAAEQRLALKANEPYTPTGIEDVTFHSLRHTFASLLISQGRDPVFVSRQLGHADPSITLKVYAHLFNAARHAREARDELEREYGGLLSIVR